MNHQEQGTSYVWALSVASVPIYTGNKARHLCPITTLFLYCCKKRYWNIQQTAAFSRDSTSLNRLTLDLTHQSSDISSFPVSPSLFLSCTWKISPFSLLISYKSPQVKAHCGNSPVSNIDHICRASVSVSWKLKGRKNRNSLNPTFGLRKKRLIIMCFRAQISQNWSAHLRISSK